MTKKGWMAAGLTIGLIAGSCVSAFAAEGLKYVQASINDTFKFQVNGEEKALDDEYTVLVYKDRTYLPVRGIGELMGADIDWDDATKTVLIDTSSICNPDNENNGENGDVETPGEPDISNYVKLPQVLEDTKMRVEVQGYFEDDQGAMIYVSVKNKDTGALRLRSSSVEYTVDGKIYTRKDTINGYWDTRWLSQACEKDQKLEGYLRMPKDLEKPANMKLHFELAYDGSDTVYPFDFNIAL